MAKKMTLVERAMARPRKQHVPITDEHIDLALAWLRGDVTVTQAGAVLFPAEVKPGSRVLYRLAICLREAHRLGQLQVAA
jgi:hypothetical protein